MLFPSVLAFLILIAALPVFAQEVVVIPDEEAATHLVKRIEPAYPSFALAAGIQGVVRVRLRVVENGSTEFVDCEGGPWSLLSAAQEAAAHYTYAPFEHDGKTIVAEFLADVPFRLPSGVRSRTYKAPALSVAEFFVPHTTMPVTALPPDLQTWIANSLKRDQSVLGLVLPVSASTIQIQERLASTTFVAIPVAASNARLYLLTTRTKDECGNHGQCHVRLVEERAGAILLIADASANGFTFYPHAGSAYPDVFLSDHGGASDLVVKGFSNVGGEWSQLYCGDILTDSATGTKKNEVRECR